MKRPVRFRSSYMNTTRGLTADRHDITLFDPPKSSDVALDQPWRALITSPKARFCRREIRNAT